LKNVGHIQVGDNLFCSSCHQNGPKGKPQDQEDNFHQRPGSMPQGLAANLSRLASNKQQGPAAAGQDSNDWSQKLNADKAGMATNAEDFTKQFMKQLTGGQ